MKTLTLLLLIFLTACSTRSDQDDLQKEIIKLVPNMLFSQAELFDKEDLVDLQLVKDITMDTNGRKHKILWHKSGARNYLSIEYNRGFAFQEICYYIGCGQLEVTSDSGRIIVNSQENEGVYGQQGVSGIIREEYVVSTYGQLVKVDNVLMYDLVW